MKEVKQNCGYWLTKTIRERLKEKAAKFYAGKGAVERYLEDIANHHILIIKNPDIKIHVEM